MVFQAKSAVVLLLICFVLAISCNKSENSMQMVSVDVKAIPVVRTENVSTLVSDSGITRFRMTTKLWEMYSNEKEPYWYFPKKIHVERFDSLFHVDTNIVADTAYYFEKKGLWRAVGNVVVKNTEGRTFETSELFWDRKVPEGVVNAFYTHKLVKILEPDGSYQYGTNGFASDQSLNTIRLFSMKADLAVEDSSDTIQQNTIKPDSAILQHQNIIKRDSITLQHK